MNITKQRLWSDDEIDRLVILCNDGLSSSQIGKILGRTRNSVISKCDRKGIKLRHPSGGFSINGPILRSVVVSEVKDAAAKKRAEALRIKAERAAAIMIESISRKASDVSSANVTISDQTICTPRHWITRKFGECAFPASESGYETKSCCNATEDGSEYCRHHKLIMTVETQVMTHRSIRFYADRYTAKNQAGYAS